MSTELKSYTIVPDSLYVERKADKQLHDIVEAMQRPGYVLVSRQMGKTNLLLRAKRKWENSEDLYVYMDMSNVDETEKECFESLIDTAIDTHEEELGSVRQRIANLRMVNVAKSPVQAHNEELRVLLSAVKGKLVFILDEIDSLTRTSFSDNVFSQIRSVYFSRVNYPVLDKLTYVLSGVVEPTEIIKNPKISPFNIGEKILLDDFSRDEYRTFLSQAGLLKFGEEVIDRIYYWAEGNPRITWDICYELQHKENLVLADVDALVKELYLTSFDKAPIDTIRSLVKEDRDLRDAIIQLAYGKGEALSDKVKSKLYLSGIVNYSVNEVVIKNRIIKESLSVNWLQKVEEEAKGLLNYAVELYTKELFNECIEKLLSYLKNNDFPEEQAPYFYFYLGTSYYRIRQFNESLKYLTLKPFDAKVTPNEYRKENLFLGVDCLNLGQYTESMDYLDKVMAIDVHDRIYYMAKLNSLIVRTRTANGDNDLLLKIEDEYKELIALPDEKEIAAIRMYAAFHLAELYGPEHSKESCDAYDTAFGMASGSVRIRILADKFSVIPIDQRQKLVEQLVAEAVNINAIASSLDPDNDLQLDEALFLRVFCLIYIYAPERWQEVRDKYNLLPDTYGDFLVRLFLIASSSSYLYGDGASRLLREIHDNLTTDEYKVSEEYYLPVYKFNAYLNQTEANTDEFLHALQLSDEAIDYYGLVVAHNYAWTLMGRKEYSVIASQLDWIIDRYPSSFTKQEIAIRALFEYALLYSFYVNSDKKSALEVGNLILSYIDEEIATATEKGRDTLKRVKENTQVILAEMSPKEPVRSTKTYGRNEWVKVRYIQTDVIVKKKYKLVEDELESGRCVLVEE